MDTKTQITPTFETGQSNKTISVTHHIIFSLLSLIALIIGMGAIYTWQHHKVTTLTSQLNNYQTTLVEDAKISLDRTNALSALPNVVVDAANSPTDLIAFLGADNTQCYKAGGGSGYYKVIAQANDQSAKMQYGCTAKGSTTPQGSIPTYILANKTGGKWNIISSTNQWLLINSQEVPSCTMVNGNKVSKLVTPQCWGGPAITSVGAVDLQDHPVESVTNP